MAAEVGKIQFKVGLKNQNGVKKEVQSLQSDISGKLSTSFGKLGVAIGAAFSVAAIIQFSKACHEGYVEAQEFELKLATIMRQRMNSTDEAIQSTKELTDALEQVGVVDGAFALAGAQQLATFLNTEEALNTLIPAMENLAAQQKGYNATSQDMVTIANLFGKVMQGQTSALNRVGITFSEAQEQALKLASEEERAAILAEIITDNVGNMNEILGDTPTGKMKQLEYAFGGIMDNVGAIVESIIYPFLDGLYTIVQYLNQATAKLAELAQMWAGISGVTLPSVSSSLGEVEEDVESVGAATNKTVFGFDNLNKLASQSASGGGGSKTSNQGGGELTNLNTTQTTNGIDNIGGSLKDLIDIAKTLGDMFGTAFNVGILTPFKNHSDDIRGIFQDLQGFTQRIVSSFEDFTGRASVKFEEFANGRFKEACEAMGGHIDDALEKFFIGYEIFIEPSLDKMTTKIESVFGEGGTLDQALDTILEDIAIMMENSGWLMNLLAAIGVLAGMALGIVGNMFVGIVESIVKSVEAGFDAIAGLFLILEGIFTGSFDKIKEGFALMIEGFLKQLQSLIMAWDAFVGTDFASSLDGVINSVSQPNVGPSSRDRQSTSHNSLSGRNSRQSTSHNSYTVIQMDKHIVGQVINSTNNRNQCVMG
jgi:hypothetical protein